MCRSAEAVNGNADCECPLYKGTDTMKAVGFDIGTTTVCGVLIDMENGTTIKTQTRKNDSWIAGETYEKLQNPDRILELVQEIYQDFLEEEEIAVIGLTGQMHGIVYIDANGNAVSPLYTWQDERGNCPVLSGDAVSEEGTNGTKTYAQELSELTDYPMATGFGLTTHYYNLKHGLVPEKAVSFTAIHGYVGMKLTGRKDSLLTASDAASFGCFDLDRQCFDTQALEKAGIDTAMLPQCTADIPLLGKTAEQILVAAAIGDNQASVIGSMRQMSESLLINIGTSSQISMCRKLPNAGGRKQLQQTLQSAGIELRPVMGDWYLMVGAGLCGGRAYAILERFFGKIVELLTGEESEKGQFYDKMNQMLDRRGLEEGQLKIDTRFCGTRQEPDRTGGIRGLSEQNFTPEEFTYGVLRGMAEELESFYNEMKNAGSKTPNCLVGSGNAIRSNPHLRKIFEQMFHMEMQIPQHREEAAYGAALAAVTAGGYLPSLEETQRKMIKMIK